MNDNPFSQRMAIVKEGLPSLWNAIKEQALNSHDDAAVSLEAEEIVQKIEQYWTEECHLAIAKGIGDGAWLELFSKRLLAQANNSQGLMIIEPNSYRFLRTLERREIDAALASGFVLWCVGQDWERQWNDLNAERRLAGGSNLIAFPVYRHLPPEELGVYARIDDFLHETVPLHQKRFQSIYANAQKYYQHPHLPIRRIWMPIYEQDHATAFVMNGLADGLRSCGAQVKTCRIPVGQYRGASAEAWSFLGSQPDAAITTNRTFRSLYGAFGEGLAAPTVLWFTDAPVFGSGDQAISSRDIVCCFDPYYIPDLSARLGVPVEPLLTAANLLEPAMADPALACGVSVIASVLSIEKTLAPLAQEDRRYVRETAEAKADNRFLDLERMIAETPPPGPLQKNAISEVAFLVYKVANALYRRKAAGKLTSFDLGLWGSSGPWLEGERDNSPLRRACRGFIRDYRQLAAVYRSSRIHVSIHSLNAISGLNMHVWNAPVQETFLLTEALPGIKDLFRIGEEIACFETADDLPNVVERWLGDEAGRREVAKAGRERVLREHTFALRAKQLLRIMESRLSLMEHSKESAS
ncbi:MAG: glycosyltransferase [Candidatus Omnitrophota bacterium]